MMEEQAEVHQPFRVKGVYWLLDPPHSNSGIVQQHMNNLALPTTELADLTELQCIIQGTLAMLDSEKSHNVLIGSQCNRLMKHFQASAIYLATYKHIAIEFIQNIHEAMKWLFSKPRRETVAKELLATIAEVSAIVFETAEHIVSNTKKMDMILRRSTAVSSWSLICGEDEMKEDLAEITETVSISLTFWEKLTNHFHFLLELANEIKMVSVCIIGNLKKFEAFKERVLEMSSGWIAVKRVCFLHDKFVMHDVDATKCIFPRVTCSSADFTSAVRLYFEEIAAFLMTDNYSMRNDIVIYSTWVQPKLAVSMSKCLEVALEAMQLKNNASKQFMEVKQHSQKIIAVTAIYVQRLRVIEEYAVRQQESLMRNSRKLEIELKRKQELIPKKQKEIKELRDEVKNNEAVISKADKNKVEAEQKKKEIQRIKENREKDVRHLENLKKETEQEIREIEKKLSLIEQKQNKKKIDEIRVSNENQLADHAAINTNCSREISEQRRPLENEKIDDHEVQGEEINNCDDEIIIIIEDDDCIENIKKFEKMKLIAEAKLEEVEKKAKEIWMKEANLLEGEKCDENVQGLEHTSSTRQERNEDKIQKNKTSISWLLKLKNSFFLCCKQAIQRSDRKALEQNRIACKSKDKKLKLLQKIEVLETRVTYLQNEVQELSSKISKMEEKRIYSIDTLQEMKHATAILKESISRCDEFIDTMKFAGNRVDFAKRLAERIDKSKDPEAARKSKGTETIMAKFKDAFETADELLQKQWQYIVCYKYTCVMCDRELEGLPLPVDDDTVICCSCAETLI